MKWIPKILSLVFLWGAVASVVVFIDPAMLKDVLIPGTYLPFFILITIALWYTLAILTKSILASLVITLTIVAGIILTMLGLMHWGLAATLLLTLVMESWYTYHRHEKIHSTNEQKNRSSSL